MEGGDTFVFTLLETLIIHIVLVLVVRPFEMLTVAPVLLLGSGGSGGSTQPPASHHPCLDSPGLSSSERCSSTAGGAAGVQIPFCLGSCLSLSASPHISIRASDGDIPSEPVTVRTSVGLTLVSPPWNSRVLLLLLTVVSVVTGTLPPSPPLPPVQVQFNCAVRPRAEQETCLTSSSPK